MPTAATTVADVAAERLAKRQAGTEARYWELVRAAAREEGEFNPDEACDFLEQTGRDPHEFQDHVARIRAPQEALDAELKQRTDEFLAAQRAHQEAVEPLRQESITLGSLHK